MQSLDFSVMDLEISASQLFVFFVGVEINKIITRNRTRDEKSEELTEKIKKLTEKLKKSEKKVRELETNSQEEMKQSLEFIQKVNFEHF